MDDVRIHRAMIVDDDPVIRKVLRRALLELDFECLEVASGEEAIERIEEWRPSLAIVDIEMPTLDGFETSRIIRQRLGDNVAILVATGHDDPETIDKAFEAGASDFIDKPVDWTLLRHRVRFLMRAHAAFDDVKQNERRLTQAQKLAKIGYWEWRPEQRGILCSEEARRILGLPLDTLLSIDELIAAAPADERDKIRLGYESVADGRSWTFDHRVGEDGSTVVRQQATRITGEAGKLHAISGTVQDITDRARAAEQIRNLSYYDGLTGLPNQRMIQEYIEELVESAADTQAQFAVIRISLDRFDYLTSSIGADRRDELILEIAARLELRINGLNRQAEDERKPAGVIGRLGADQFAVVVRDANSTESAQLVATQILDIMRAPFLIEGNAFAIVTSIGVAVYPIDGDEAFAVFHSAEVALRDAESACPGSYRMANPDLQSQNDRRLKVQWALSEALEQDQLEAYYQPQWRASTGEIAGVELLARWTSPSLGVVSPGEFVPIAEDSGLITKLSEWTIEAACRQLRAWLDAGIEPIPVSINISPRFIETTDAVGTIEAMVERYAVDPRMLECEFTETAMIANEESVLQVATALRDLGIRTALDDFGTGYSSLQHLVRFPLDTVKIDLSFVMRIEHDRAARTICSTLLAMAEELELEVVAEGVETEAQFTFLRDHGCAIMQGFLLSPAVEAASCIAIRDERAAASKAPRSGESFSS